MDEKRKIAGIYKRVSTLDQKREGFSLPEPGDYLIYYNTAGYQMDSNESNFHKIPLVKKFVVEKSGNKYEIREDDKYDC